jgi:hypothetical protein
MLTTEQECREYCTKELAKLGNDMWRYKLSEGQQISGHNWKFDIVPVHPAYIDIGDSIIFNPFDLKMIFLADLQFSIHEDGIKIDVYEYLNIYTSNFVGYTDSYFLKDRF